MARRKIKEVEEADSINEDEKNNKKRPKAADIKPRRQIKRKISESEQNDDLLEPIKEPVQRKKPLRTNSRKPAKPKDVHSVNNQKNLVDSEENNSVSNGKIKIIEPEQNEDLLEPKKKVLQRKKSVQISLKKPAELSNVQIVTDQKNVADCEENATVSKRKKQPPAKKKSIQMKPKSGTKSETVPKLKKAKVILHKIKLEKNCDDKSGCTASNSIDSGILSKAALKKENCVSSIKNETSNSLLKSLEKSDFDGEASTSEEEWEEVEENNEPDLDDYKPEIPKEGVEITIDCPDLKIHKRKKKQFDWMDYVRLQINRQRKEYQLNTHKTHLLCLLAHGLYVNNVLNSPILKGIALSLLPFDMLNMFSGKKIDKINADGIENVVKWFRKTFSFEREKDSFLNFSESIVSYFENKNSLNASEYNLMFVVLARNLGFKTRFCISLYPLTHKAQNLIKKYNPKKDENESQSLSEGKMEVEAIAGPSEIKSEKRKVNKKEPKENKKVHKVLEKKVKDIESNTTNAVKRSRPRRSTEKSYKLSDDESDIEDKDEDYVASEDDFEERKLPRKSLVKTPKQKVNRKVLSSDSAPSSPETSSFKSDKIVCWAEVFSKSDKQWVSIECVNNIVNKPYDIEEKLPQPVTYIVAFDNESFVKDVTRRYCSNYMLSTIKLRADSEWWEKTLVPFAPPNSKLDKDEEKNLETLLINKPLPHTVSGFKNHPLYALKRHLLKFEGIYPPDASSIGFIRGEPVYARECVCPLHSRETWLKEARVVRIGEEPYKIVKARPKWDRMAGVLKTDLPLEIFGFWQTEPYEPPIAVDGKVPRNEYGNVELFKSCMLPKGTVHLQLPGLNRIAKKLGIDCSPAVVGFDGHKGSVHAVFDGFIICEEYKDTIIAAWDEEQVNAQKREEEKREKRIYGNWRKLIRGLLIRERIKLKYDTK